MGCSGSSLKSKKPEKQRSQPYKGLNRAKSAGIGKTNTGSPLKSALMKKKIRSEQSEKNKLVSFKTGLITSNTMDKKNSSKKVKTEEQKHSKSSQSKGESDSSSKSSSSDQDSS